MVINIIMNGYTNTIVRKRTGTFKDWQERNMKDLGGPIKHYGRLIDRKSTLLTEVLNLGLPLY